VRSEEEIGQLSISFTFSLAHFGHGGLGKSPSFSNVEARNSLPSKSLRDTVGWQEDAEEYED
jgi:hypothetical protein